MWEIIQNDLSLEEPWKPEHVIKATSLGNVKVWKNAGVGCGVREVAVREAELL